MTSVAILQSNYIPWKGYFDLIASVDEFILYDEVQFTKNDWRNRNRIKTARGVEWLSIPVGQDIRRSISEVQLSDPSWQEKHWRTLVTNYAKARHFHAIAALLEPIYLHQRHCRLSELNRCLIETICRYLRIHTRITDSAEYPLEPPCVGDDGKSSRLLSLCSQVHACRYVSGPSASSYLDVPAFTRRGIEVAWFDYEGYPEYPQRWGGFEHAVSILDLLFNCGPSAPDYMLFHRPPIAAYLP
jgi:hypothetical protein